MPARKPKEPSVIDRARMIVALADARDEARGFLEVISKAQTYVTWELDVTGWQEDGETNHIFSAEKRLSTRALQVLLTGAVAYATEALKQMGADDAS